MNQFVISPCVSICEVNEHNMCLGCLRTLDEIAAWGMMSHAERLRIMTEELPKREAQDVA